MTLRDIVIGLGFKMDDKAVNDVEGKIQGVKNFAVKALGAIGIGFSLVNMNQLAEEFNGINDQIRNATSGLGDQKAIQDKIMKSANDTKMSYADTAKVVGALVQENKELFGNVDEAIAFNDAVTKTFKAAGKSNEQIAGLTESINKSFAKGKVDTETLNQLMEQSPEAVAYLNKQLESTTDQLEKLAADGKISLSDLKEAFVSNSTEINAKFGDLDYSISDAMLNIRNKWGYWLDDLNSTAGLTSSLGGLMTKAFDKILVVLNKVKDATVWVINQFGGVENILKFIAIAAGAIWFALNAQKILSFFKNLTSMLNVANLKILLIIAVIIAIALIVEDFINFMQGNDSVIGEVFKKMGIDADAVREKFLQVWGKIKQFLQDTWQAIVQLASQIVQKLKEFWAQNGEEIMQKLSAIWNGLCGLLKVLWDGLSAAAKSIFGGLSAFWEAWGDKIMAVFGVIFDAVGSIFMGFIEIIQGIIDFLVGVFTGDWEKAWSGIVEIFTGIWDAVVSFLQGIWDAIYALFGEQIDAIVEKIMGFVNKIKEVFGAIKDFFGGIGDAIGDFFGGNNTVDVNQTTVANAATGTGNKTSNVKQDVTINNTFNGTGQQEMSSAANKASDDTTSQMARGLAYGT